MSFPLSSQHETLSFDAGGDDPPALNLAAFVDIILQLICFYVLVSGSIQRYSDPDVRLPQMKTTAAVEKQPAELVVNVKADGSVMLNDRSVSLPELGPLLAERRRRPGIDDGQTVRVTIRIDRRQRYGSLEDVLEACRAAGVPRIALRTVEADEP